METQFEEPIAAVAAFLKIASGLYPGNTAQNPASIEAELYRMVENEAQDAIQVGGHRFKLVWVPCGNEPCNQPNRN